MLLITLLMYNMFSKVSKHSHSDDKTSWLKNIKKSVSAIPAFLLGFYVKLSRHPVFSLHFTSLIYGKTHNNVNDVYIQYISFYFCRMLI